MRHAIKEVSDESKYTDSLLYEYWKLGRAKFLGQTLKKKNKINRGNWHTFCIELEQAKSHDCTCVPVGCTVLKTKYIVPEVLASYTQESRQVLTLDGSYIPYRTEAQRRTDKYDDIKKNELGYMIHNGKIVVWDNSLALKAIQVRGIFTDPLAWQDIQLCTDANPCKDIYDLDSGLSEEDEVKILEYVRRELRLEFARPSDASQDSNAEIR